MTDAADAIAGLTQRLAATFRVIEASRMRDLPLLNPALAVEPVGFRPWQGNFAGALVTPWFINLVMLPGDGNWRAVPDGGSVWYAFPSGRFEFIAASEPGLGSYHACSLYSPVQEFADQETARETARLALESLFDPTLLGESPGRERTGGVAMSRRDFLRGASAARS